MKKELEAKLTQSRVSHKRYREVPQRYDMPQIRTSALVWAVRHACGQGLVGMVDWMTASNILDAIKQIIPNPTIQDAKVATYLMGQDCGPAEIKQVCDCIRPETAIGLSGEQQDELAQLLERRA